MKTCLQNCKPGDIIKCTLNYSYIVVALPNRHQQVEVVLESGSLGGFFTPDNVGMISRIIKKAK